MFRDLNIRFSTVLAACAVLLLVVTHSFAQTRRGDRSAASPGVTSSGAGGVRIDLDKVSPEIFAPAIPESTAVGRSSVMLSLAPEIVPAGGPVAFEASGFLGGETIQLYFQGVLSGAFPAEADGRSRGTLINGSPVVGRIEFVGTVSGRRVGGVFQVASTGPFVPGLAAAPHAVNTAAAGTIRFSAVGYPVGSTVTLKRNNVIVTTAVANASGVATFNVTPSNNGNVAAIYTTDTGAADSMAGISIEERSDAGTGDHNVARAFLDRPLLDTAIAGGMGISAEAFLPGETVALSGAVTGNFLADANGAAGGLISYALPPGAAGNNFITFTGQTSGRVARLAWRTDPLVENVRGMIVSPQISFSGGTVVVNITRMPPNEPGELFLDGVSLGSGATNDIGSVNFNVPKPASGFMHYFEWVGASGLRAAAPYMGTANTAAGVTVTGSVLGLRLRTRREATVTLTDPAGGQQSVTTGRAGAFRFEGVEAGRTYVISVTARGLHYESQTVTVNDNVSGLTFYPSN